MDSTDYFLKEDTIVLKPLLLLYDGQNASLTTTTDSTGFYSIDSVIPGNYDIQFIRDGYLVSVRKYSMKIGDEIRDYALPKPLLNQVRLHLNYLSGNPRLSWKDHSFSIFTQYINDKGLPLDKIYTCRFNRINDQLSVESQMDNPMGNASYYFHFDKYFYLGTQWKLKRYQTDTLNELEEIPLADPVSGLTRVNNAFWSVYQTKLQYRGADASSVEREYPIPTGILKNLTFDGETFWTCNPIENLLFKVSQQGQVLGTYHPVDRSNPMLYLQPYDIDFSLNNNQLWMTDAEKKIVYSFPVPN